MVRIGAVLLGLVAIATGCKPGAFTCNPQSAVNECVHANGSYAACISPADRCAVPAPDCPSGWRFDSNAGDLAGQCVPVGTMVPVLPDMGSSDMATSGGGDMALLPPGTSTLTWTRIPAPPGDVQNFISVWGISGAVYIGGFGGMLYSPDGKSGFVPVGFSDKNNQVYSVGGIAGNLLAGGIRVIQHATTDPTKWDQLQQSFLAFSVFANNAGSIYVGSDQSILQVTAGPQFVPIDSGYEARAIWSIGSEVFAGGRDGIRHSSDGKNFTSATLPVSQVNLLGMWGSAADDVYAVGIDGAGGWVFHSVDHGQTWIATQLGPQALGIWGSARDDIYVVGASGSLWHSDGQSWRRLPTVGTEFLNGIWGSGPHDVWIVGQLGTIFHGQ